MHVYKIDTRTRPVAERTGDEGAGFVEGVAPAVIKVWSVVWRDTHYSVHPFHSISLSSENKGLQHSLTASPGLLQVPGPRKEGGEVEAADSVHNAA